MGSLKTLTKAWLVSVGLEEEKRSKIRHCKFQKWKHSSKVLVFKIEETSLYQVEMMVHGDFQSNIF